MSKRRDGAADKAVLLLTCIVDFSIGRPRIHATIQPRWMPGSAFSFRVESTRVRCTRSNEPIRRRSKSPIPTPRAPAAVPFRPPPPQPRALHVAYRPRSLLPPTHRRRPQCLRTTPPSSSPQVRKRISLYLVHSLRFPSSVSPV